MHDSPSPRRPLIVTILVIGVFCLSIGHALSLGTSLSRRALFLQLDTSFPIEGIIFLSSFWMILWAGVALALWIRFSAIRRTTMIVFVLYHLSRIGQNLLFVEGAYEQGRVPMMILTGFWTTALIVFVLTRHSVKKYYAINTR